MGTCRRATRGRVDRRRAPEDDASPDRAPADSSLGAFAGRAKASSGAHLSTGRQTAARQRQGAAHVDQRGSCRSAPAESTNAVDVPVYLPYPGCSAKPAQAGQAPTKIFSKASSSVGVSANQLDHQALFTLPEDRVDRAHDPEISTDRHPFADLEPTTNESTGRDNLTVPPQLVAVLNQLHSEDHDTELAP